jgi:hypothetical protein
MALPTPEPGLVISYEYLWGEQAAAGRETGVKSRPCVIVVAVTREAGEIVVLVAPITHSPPRSGQAHVELPALVKQQLRLDRARSWAVTDELNRFVWPGHDLRVRSDEPSRFDYGFLPPALFRQIRAGIGAIWAADRGVTVSRS